MKYCKSIHKLSNKRDRFLGDPHQRIISVTSTVNFYMLATKFNARPGSQPRIMLVSYSRDVFVVFKSIRESKELAGGSYHIVVSVPDVIDRQYFPDYDGLI